MILIVGSTRDDVLYFKSIIKNEKDEVILKKYHVTIGTIFNQQVMILSNVYSSYVTSALVNYLIEKYFILITYVVGKCMSYTPTLKNGDIAISRHIVLGDVDYSDIPNTVLAQIPNWEQVYEVQPDVFKNMTNSFENISFGTFAECTFVSSNMHYKKLEQIKNIEESGHILNIKENVVIDGETGGVMIACKLHDIPCISIKVIESHIGEKVNVNHYVQVLKNYAKLGRAVVACIGEMGRNDILR